MKYDYYRTVQNLKQLQDDIMSTKTKNLDDKYRHYAELEQLICIAKSKREPREIIEIMKLNGVMTYVAFK